MRTWYGKVLLATAISDTFLSKISISWIMDAERDEVKGIRECDVCRVKENRERIGEQGVVKEFMNYNARQHLEREHATHSIVTSCRS